MRTSFYALIALLGMVSGCAFFPGPPASPVTLDAASAEKITKEIQKQRVDEKEWLRSSPTSYLAAVDRVDFNQKQTLTVGRAADNDVQLAGDAIEAHHLRVTVAGDRFHIECLDSAAQFKIGKELKRDATVAPSYFEVGRFTLRLSHQHHPAIIIFDPRSPRYKEYKGISYFPVDLSYRYELPLHRYSKREKIVIGSTRGNLRNAELVGWVEFLVGKTRYRLEATRLLEPGSAEDEAAIFFRDGTSGVETYQLGRYVDLKKLANGNYLLDFNLAYNPACAFSNYYNCPIPPKSNVLNVSIRAGEKDSYYGHSRNDEFERPLSRRLKQWALSPLTMADCRCLFIVAAMTEPPYTL